MRTIKGRVADAMSLSRETIPGSVASLQQALEQYQQRHGGSSATSQLYQATKACMRDVEILYTLQSVYATLDGPEEEVS